jgi:hypothetical protein
MNTLQWIVSSPWGLFNLASLIILKVGVTFLLLKQIERHRERERQSGFDADITLTAYQDPWPDPR